MHDSAVFLLGAASYSISSVTTVDVGPGANRVGILVDAVVPEPGSLAFSASPGSLLHEASSVYY